MIVEELVAKIGLSFTGVEKAAEAAGHVHSLKEALLGLGGVFSAVKTAFEGLSLHVAEEVLHLEHYGEAVGISVSSLQALGVAAGRAGGSIDDVETGLRFLANNSVSAAEGNEQAQKAFAKLGVSVRDASGHMKTVEQLLPDIQQGFEKIHDPSARVAVSMDLFGRSGLRTLQALQQVGDDFGAFKDKLIESGRVMSQETIERFVNVAKGFNAIGGRLKGLQNLLAEAFLPSTERMIALLTKVFNAVTPYFRPFARRLADLVTAPFLLLNKAVEGLHNALGGLGKYREVLYAIAGAAAFVGAVFAVPIVAVGVLAFLIGAIAEDIDKFLKGQKSLLGVVVAEWENFKFQLQDLAKTGTFLESTFARLLNTLIDIGRVFKSVFGGDQKDANAAFSQLFGNLKESSTPTRTLNLALDAAKSRSKARTSAQELGTAAVSPLSNEALTTINVSVNAAPGMDETVLSRKAADEMKRAVGDLRAKKMRL